MSLTDTASAVRMVRSPGLKLLVIVLLTVAMAVPLFLVQMAVSDRQKTAEGAAADIAQGYGGPQTVAGPVLLIPYTQTHTETIDGKQVSIVQHLTAVLLPDDLNYRVKADTETRSRGIFPVPVYRANVDMKARFSKTALAGAVPQGAEVWWKDVAVAVLVSDARGLADNVTLSANGQVLPFEPGASWGAVLPADGAPRVAAIEARLNLQSAADLNLDTHFLLRGSREFSLSPLGRRTVANIDSTWASPSFFGAFLPSEREVTNHGFRAAWTVPYLARGFGQVFGSRDEALQSVMSQAFGARFYQPVDHYQMVQRALKYAVLFLALSFLVFFVVETVAQRRIHVVQYAMVGAAQVLFYLLLLSFAEHMGFAGAYAIAAAATVILTALYAVSALASFWRGAVIGVILAGLYAMLYLILNSEDNALLMGSCVLFAALAGTMFFTRRIDWYRVTGNATT
jgi:inner membrane protein